MEAIGSVSSPRSQYSVKNLVILFLCKLKMDGKKYCSVHYEKQFLKDFVQGTVWTLQWTGCLKRKII